MKNIQIFDVIELFNGNKATILDINNNSYSVEIVDKKGNSLGFQKISKDEIKEIIYSHK